MFADLAAHLNKSTGQVASNRISIMGAVPLNEFAGWLGRGPKVIHFGLGDGGQF